MIHTLEIASNKRNQLIDITSQIQALLSVSNIADGRAEIFIPHTTAAITINENADPDVKSDLLGCLEKMIPQNGPFRHSEGNSDAHIKASLVGAYLSVFVTKGKLVLGTWQEIYFCEFDGPRHRQVIVKITEDQR